MMDRRTYLISVFEDTLRRIENNPNLTAKQQLSMAKQKFISEKAALNLPLSIYNKEAEVVVSHNRTFEAAAAYTNLHLCVLNFASATNPGGGVRNGSSAQEECLCRCSTLYNCLNTPTMWNFFYEPHRRNANVLHNDDIIFTPDVMVIKSDDYVPLEEPFAADVITCAAPNLRDQSTNLYNMSEGAPVKITPDQLFSIHQQRARRIFTVAAMNDAQVLILGAFGCWAFRNDPAIVAQAYQAVLPEFLHHFAIIEFAIYCPPHDDNNYRTFCHFLSD